jgi:hypothetical protein
MSVNDQCNNNLIWEEIREDKQNMHTAYYT